MSFDPSELRRMARRQELYPAVILHGGTAEERRETALDLARTLLCEAPEEERPCGRCRHCSRIAWAGSEDTFHPDFLVLERDLKTVTSVEATRNLMRAAQLSPFEARGQVFVIADAETLSPEASNSLLKVIEEPPAGAPRHFFLLCPAVLDLLPTLRSRSLEVFLGDPAGKPGSREEEVARMFAAAAERWWRTGAPIFLLVAADALGKSGDWEDPRASEPWARAAQAVGLASQSYGLSPRHRLAFLDLGADLLSAEGLRIRGIPADRILGGLVAKHLAGASELARSDSNS